jgi:hypothetical protein
MFVTVRELPWSAVGLLCGGGLNVVAIWLWRRERSRLSEKTLTIFIHDVAQVSGRILARQIETLFKSAGWQIRFGRTDLPQHARGIRIHGATETERSIVDWALRSMNVSAEIDEAEDSVLFQVTIGVHEQHDPDQTIKHQTEQINMLEGVLEQTQREREDLRGKLGNAQHEMLECRKDTACWRLKVTGLQLPNKTVTVRYLEYSDAALADYIAGTFKRHTGWQVELKRDAESHLIQETQWRVSFASGDPEFVRRLWEIFTNGNLIGEAISPREIMEKQTTDPNIIVTIFPRAVA